VDVAVESTGGVEDVLREVFADVIVLVLALVLVVGVYLQVVHVSHL